MTGRATEHRAAKRAQGWLTQQRYSYLDLLVASVLASVTTLILNWWWM